MLKQEYLEVIKLTERLLLQQIPSKPPMLPKMLTAPMEASESPLPVAPKPPVVLKQEPVRKEKPIPEPLHVPVQTPPCNLDPILEMLKTHCPRLQLVDLPIDIKKTVMILFDAEPENEKKLLENIEAALKKEGLKTHLLHASELKVEQLQNPAHILIGSRMTFSNQSHIKIHARRDASGKLLIGESGALAISSLSELILQPVKRREVWNQILALL